MPPGRAKSDGAPCNLFLHLKIPLQPQNLDTSSACGRLGRQSSFLLLLVLLLFFPLQSPSPLQGLSTSVTKTQMERAEKRRRPLRFILTFPSAGPVPLQPRAGVQQQFPRPSVCLSAAGLGCVLPPSPSLPPVSSQTKVGDAFFRSQRQLVSSFPETITLLLRTNVDICRERGKKQPRKCKVEGDPLPI